MMLKNKWKKTQDRTLHRNGFTLVEVLCASVIIGIGFLAILASVSSSTKVSHASSDITQAIFLTQEIREWTANLPFRDTDPSDISKPVGPDSYSSPGVPYVDDLDDLMNATFSPPRNGLGDAITDMDGWSQTVNITWRSPSAITTSVVPGTSEIIHVQVAVSKNNEVLLQTGWLVTEEGGIE